MPLIVLLHPGDLTYMHIDFVKQIDLWLMVTKILRT